MHSNQIIINLINYLKCSNGKKMGVVNLSLHFSLPSFHLKKQGAENVSIGYCHPQCFIYRWKQILQNYEKLKKHTNYDLLYLRSCIIS
jgi:hypothetical protein